MSEVPEDYLPQIEAMGPGAAGAAKFAGKTLAYPYDGGNGYFLYYNKNLLKAEDVSSIEGLLAKATTLGMKVAYPLETAYYSHSVLIGNSQLTHKVQLQRLQLTSMVKRVLRLVKL